MTFKVLDIHGVRVYGIFFHMSKAAGIIGFWQHPGIGISTRLADFLRSHVDTLQDLPLDGSKIGDEDDYVFIPKPTYLLDTPVHGQLRERIVSLMKRAPAPAPPDTSISGPPILTYEDPVAPQLTSEDVYLFPTGMAALYRLHSYLNAYNMNDYKSVAFGCLFHSTLDILLDYGAGFELFGRGDESDLVALEKFLKSEIDQERKVQALYVEFPSNPVLVSSPLARLRALADKYEFVLVVDDTVGGFANIDIFSVADVVVTSLTKSFSGYADVMGGSIVLNPRSPLYRSKLRPLLKNNFHNEVFVEDAVVLEKNSRDYLQRSAILNRNAEALVTILQRKAEDPSSAVSELFYPTVSPTRDNYRPFMRASTPEFTPGYGCLFSVEFEDIQYTAAFYDALEVHKGPHLGAHLTLALPYNKAMYTRTPDDEARAEKFGWSMKQVRVSVGLEDVDDLVERFEEAVKVVDQLKMMKMREMVGVVVEELSGK
jgi:cystathionine gamma-synthase